jgi:hypothetical protein
MGGPLLSCGWPCWRRVLVKVLREECGLRLLQPLCIYLYDTPGYQSKMGIYDDNDIYLSITIIIWEQWPVYHHLYSL